MAVITRRLAEADSWQIAYDTNARKFFLESSSNPKQLTVNEFLALDPTTPAAMAMEGLIIDMFGPETDEGSHG
jgi:hypothetical protein